MKANFEALRAGIVVTGKEGELATAAVNILEQVVTDIRRIADAHERIAKALERRNLR